MITCFSTDTYRVNGIYIDLITKTVTSPLLMPVFGTISDIYVSDGELLVLDDSINSIFVL